MIWFACSEISDPDSDEEDEDEDPFEMLEEPNLQCRFVACASPGIGCRKGIKTNPGSKIPGFTGSEGSLPGGDLFWHPTRPIAVLNMSLNYWDEAVEVSESSIRIYNFEKIEGPHRK